MYKCGGNYAYDAVPLFEHQRSQFVQPIDLKHIEYMLVTWWCSFMESLNHYQESSASMYSTWEKDRGERKSEKERVWKSGILVDFGALFEVKMMPWVLPQASLCFNWLYCPIILRKYKFLYLFFRKIILRNFVLHRQKCTLLWSVYNSKI